MDIGGIAHAKLVGLHGTHRGSNYGEDVVDAEMLLEELVLRTNRVAESVTGEIDLEPAVCRARGEIVTQSGVAKKIRRHDEVLVRVQGFSGSD